MKRVFLTGANGFVGRHLCRQLLTDGGHVLGGIRRPHVARDLPNGVEPIVVPDICEEYDWESVLCEVDSVVHLAARTHVLRDRHHDPQSAYRRINVEGTGRLLQGAVRAGVGRFVFLSSIKAVGEGASEPYTEQTPCHPSDHYGSSKREAEQLVLRTAQQSNLQCVILRPTLIYGPGVGGNFARIVRAVEKGLPLPFGSIRNARSLLYVGNLVDAISQTLEHPAAANKVFHVADAEILSTPDLIRQLARHLGCRSRIFPMPVSALRFLGLLTGRRREIRRLIGSLTVSTDHIHRELGWTPPFRVDEGLCQTIGGGPNVVSGTPPRQSPPQPHVQPPKRPLNISRIS